MIDYENCTIIAYPPKAGGKFLANCLALNEHAVFQDAKLAQLQLNKSFSVQDKIHYLDKKLQEAKIKKEWRDLDLGHGQLFGIDVEIYNEHFHEIIYKKINTGVILNCIQKKLQLFADVHSLGTLDNMQKFWGINGKTIIFTNYRKFVDERSKESAHGEYIDLLQYWNTIRGGSWPNDPPKNHSQLTQLPGYIQDELKNVFYNEITRFFSYIEDYDLLWTKKTKLLKKQHSVFEFDVNYAYENCHQFYKVYTQLCNFLKLPIQEKKIIDWYFNEWHAVITFIGKF